MTTNSEASYASAVPRLVVVLTTWPADVEAERLARPLVEERLAACVNVLPPMVSFYRWQGSLQRDPEHQVVIKTTASRLEALEARLRDLHPYELPELIVLDAGRASSAYLTWVDESTRLG